jgi:stage IV sporulation protein FB
MIRFSIFGIPVEVHFYFWIILAIFGGALSANTPDDIFRIILFMIAGFFSVLVHELGHALSARKFGAYSRITLEAFGGYAAYSGTRLNRLQSFLVTAAGPAVQIALGIVTLILWKSLPDATSYGKYFLSTLTIISFFWAILNLLPVMPLDGGQMLNSVMGPSRIKLTHKISIAVAVVAAIAVFRYTGSFIFPIFLGMFAWQSYQALQQPR